MNTQESAASRRDILDRAYGYVANEEDARVCKDIPDEACRVVPENFFRHLGTNVLTRLGDAVVNPKTVLAWLVPLLQAPEFILSLLVPIRESGSLLPQLLIAQQVRRLQVRKWSWVVGALGQAFSVLAMAAVVFFLSGWTAGLALLLLLTTFSLSRGICSVAAKDVIGKTVPKTRRGRLNGLSSTVSGLLVIGLGLGLSIVQEQSSLRILGLIMLAAGLIWLAGAALYATIDEHPGETGGGGNAWETAMEQLSLLRTDAAFRRFVLVRTLFIATALTSPFIVLLTQQRLPEEGLTMLGLFVLASGVGDSISATVWGVQADRSSRRVMIKAGTGAAVIGIVVALSEWLDAGVADTLWFYTVLYFLLTVCHSGMRVGRKTYLVDMAGGNKRTDYVAVSNTVIGIALLVAGLISAGLAAISVPFAVFALALMALAGTAICLRLPEVQEE
ncbi:MAG TPA: MFS transporter [Arenicellales bacterium]|nr:MFS transporter [Arenicellales bacterium]